MCMSFFLNYRTADLDQLNHILGVLGSPTLEDLQCIKNDKVYSGIMLLLSNTPPPGKHNSLDVSVMLESKYCASRQSSASRTLRANSH